MSNFGVNDQDYKLTQYQIPIRIFGCEWAYLWPVHLLLFYTWYGKYPIINAFVPTSTLAYPNAHSAAAAAASLYLLLTRRADWALGWGLTYTGIIRMCDFRQWKKSKFLFSFHCSIDTLDACTDTKWVSVCLWMWYLENALHDEYLFVVPIFVQYLFLFIQHNPNISVSISGWCLWCDMHEVWSNVTML